MLKFAAYFHSTKEGLQDMKAKKLLVRFAAAVCVLSCFAYWGALLLVKQYR